MTGVVVDLDDAARDVRGQPLAVGRRDEHVGGAVADENRDRDLADVEAPRPEVRKVVVDPAADARSRPARPSTRG